MAKSKISLIIFFIFISFLIFYRSPCYFLQEGFWQINETHFFKYSLDNNFLDSILYVYPNGGYTEFIINIATTIGSYFPEFSILIDVFLALIIKLIIVFYIYFSKSNIFFDIKYKILIICLILFSPPMTPEIWLTTLHAKAYFGIFSFLLLLQEVTRFKKHHFFFYRFAILFSGLSSIYACVLSPIFFLKYLMEKNKDNFINFVYSFIPLLINFFLILKYFLDNSYISQNRFSFDIIVLESFSYNILIRPFFGSTIPKFLNQIISLENFGFFIISVFVVSTFIIFSIYKSFKNKDKYIYLILAAFLIQSIFVIFGSLYDNFVGGRYAVIPGLIILIFFLRLIQIEKSIFLKTLFTILILSSLSIGLLEFKYLTPLPEILECKI